MPGSLANQSHPFLFQNHCGLIILLEARLDSSETLGLHEILDPHHLGHNIIHRYQLRFGATAGVDLLLGRHTDN